MSPALLPVLLGLTLLLPRTQTLTCQSLTLKYVNSVTEPPLPWTVGEEVCSEGWGCQDTLMLLENGPQELLVLTKGCTQEKDQEARVTKHRAGPGPSIVSYTQVCRHKDLCNDLSSTLPLWTPGPTIVPGSVHCPVCLSTEGCESVTKMTCPVGHTHCYNGILQLRGGNIDTKVRVQGCMPQAACNLLNETREIGSLTVREKCGADAVLTCQKGNMLQFKQNLTKEPVQWTAPENETCGLEEVCQETLLLIDVGPRSLIVGSKGCMKNETWNPQTASMHSGPSGVFIASYAHFCSSNGCNRASSTSVLLDSLPHSAVPAPGDLQCPACVQLGGFCTDSENVTCPVGTTHCYTGYIGLEGGEMSIALNIQGCMAQPSSSLLKHTNVIGLFSAKEFPMSLNKAFQSSSAPAHTLAWMVGPGLYLVLWCGMTSLITLFPCDS